MGYRLRLDRIDDQRMRTSHHTRAARHRPSTCPSSSRRRSGRGSVLPSPRARTGYVFLVEASTTHVFDHIAAILTGPGVTENYQSESLGADALAQSKPPTGKGLRDLNSQRQSLDLYRYLC